MIASANARHLGPGSSQKEAVIDEAVILRGGAHWWAASEASSRMSQPPSRERSPFALGEARRDARTALFILTRRLPEVVPAGDPSYTFVTDGVEAAIELARAVADGKNVQLMGQASSSRPSTQGCLTSSSSASCRSCSVVAIVCWKVLVPAISSSTWCGSSTLRT